MTISATIAVSVTSDAEARIAALGFQAEVERMLDYARHSLPEVERIEVVLYDRYDEPGPPRIGIEVYSRRPFDPEDRSSWHIIAWMVDQFPPEVLEQITMFYNPGGSHAG